MSDPRLDRAVDRLRRAGLGPADHLHVLLALVAAEGFAISAIALHRRAGASPEAITASITALRDQRVVRIEDDIVTLDDLSCLLALEQVALAIEQGRSQEVEDKFGPGDS